MPYLNMNILSLLFPTGYLINAMSFEECGHTFCKSCIVFKLNTNTKNCPECNMYVTLNNLKSDNTLQEVCKCLLIL